MGKLEDEFSKRIEAILNAEFSRLWHEAKGAPAATAVKYDFSAKAAHLTITFSKETTETEAESSVQRFIELCHRKSKLHGMLVTTDEQKKQKRQKSKLIPNPTAAPKTLPEALHLATPETLRLLTLIPMIREGLKSLQYRLDISTRDCTKLVMSGVVNQELWIVRKNLLEIKESITTFARQIDHFSIFDRVEAVLLDESASALVALAHECLVIERELDKKLSTIETSIERLAA